MTHTPASAAVAETVTLGRRREAATAGTTTPEDYRETASTAALHRPEPLIRRTVTPPHPETAKPVVASPRPHDDALSESAAIDGAPGPFHAIAGALIDLQNRSAWPGDAADERQLRTLLVTSTVPGEGRTHTVVNLARALADDYGRRVLIIDAERRHPAIHELLGVSNASGFTDLLSAGGEVPIHRVTPLLSVLPTGSQLRDGSRPALLMESTSAALRNCSSGFDWVLIDGPSMISEPAATRDLATFARAVLLVVARGRTPFRLVNRAISEIGRACIVGTVLNDVDAV